MSAAPTFPRVVPTLVVRASPSGEAGDQDSEPEQRPLHLALIRRIFSCTRPCQRRLGWLLAAVVVRAVQLPAGAFLIGRIIKGPITYGHYRGAWLGALAFGLLALWTAVNSHFRIAWCSISARR